MSNLLNENDVKELFNVAEPPVAHAVKEISRHLKRMASYDEPMFNLSNLKYNPKNVIIPIDPETSIDEAHMVLGMEEMVLSEVKIIAQELIEGCDKRIKEITPIINGLNKMIGESE